MYKYVNEIRADTAGSGVSGSQEFSLALALA